MISAWMQDFHLIPSPSLHPKTSLRARERREEDRTVSRAAGPSRRDGSDLPALQLSPAFASSLAERLGRAAGLPANSPWCWRDAGWQRQLAPVLGQAPAGQKKQGEESLRCRGAQIRSPCTWSKSLSLGTQSHINRLRDTPDPFL